ncbi:hypothetical protein RIF29_32936 [Crotalaria pallida]|uniref:Uncharacterized protein n=1 Tax=Crotalaria pallida TaxID=3830 RepID=A0AAN9ED23_CROPI
MKEKKQVGVPLLLPEKARRSKPHSSKTIARDPDLCLVLAAAAERSSAASFEASAFKPSRPRVLFKRRQWRQ